MQPHAHSGAYWPGIRYNKSSYTWHEQYVGTKSSYRRPLAQYDMKSNKKPKVIHTLQDDAQQCRPQATARTTRSWVASHAQETQMSPACATPDERRRWDSHRHRLAPHLITRQRCRKHCSQVRSEPSFQRKRKATPLVQAERKAKRRAEEEAREKEPQRQQSCKPRNQEEETSWIARHESSKGRRGFERHRTKGSAVK